MEKVWRIYAWVVPAVCAALLAALILFLEQVEPEFTCEWDDVWLMKHIAWGMLVPLAPLTLWNFFRRLWWPQMLLALGVVFLGVGILDLVPAHYWGDYGYEASLAALCGQIMLLVAAIGFFPAYRCGKASAISGVAVLVVLLLISLSLL